MSYRCYFLKKNPETVLVQMAFWWFRYGTPNFARTHCARRKTSTGELLLWRRPWRHIPDLLCILSEVEPHGTLGSLRRVCRLTRHTPKRSNRQKQTTLLLGTKTRFLMVLGAPGRDRLLPKLSFGNPNLLKTPQLSTFLVSVFGSLGIPTGIISVSFWRHIIPQLESIWSPEFKGVNLNHLKPFGLSL